jgi:hypothetical protein
MFVTSHCTQEICMWRYYSPHSKILISPKYLLHFHLHVGSFYVCDAIFYVVLSNYYAIISNKTCLQCSRNRLSLTSRSAWDLRLITYRSINRFYRSTISRPVFSQNPSFSTKISKICYAITTLEYCTKVLLHLNWQKWQNSSYCTLLLPPFG